MIAKHRATPVDKHIGRRVRMRRTMLQMSQEALAEKLGLTFQQVQKYEKGANRIGSGRLPLLAQALDVPISFFFEGLPGVSSTAEAHSLAGDIATTFFTIPGAADLARAFSALSDPDDRRVVTGVAVALAGTRKRKPARRVA